MQVMRDSGASVFCQAPGGWTKDESGLYVLYRLGVESFVDEDRRISSFEKPEFIEMLEFCKTYADPISQASLGSRVASGEIAFVLGSISSFSSFSYYESMFGGNPVYMGFPSPQGGRLVAGADERYYINASSPSKEGALDFMRFLLSEEQQRNMITNFDTGFPVNRELLEAMWKEAKEESPDTAQGYSQHGVSYTPRPLTDEEEQFFWSVVNQENTTPTASNRWRDEIWDIVWDEALPFFAGEKSAEEVAEVIDNRVQLLLDEKK